MSERCPSNIRTYERLQRCSQEQGHKGACSYVVVLPEKLYTQSQLNAALALRTEACSKIAEFHDGPHAASWAAKEIRKLSTDAEQCALAQRDSDMFFTTLDDGPHDGSELVVGGKEPVRIFNENALEAVKQKEYLEGMGVGARIGGDQTIERMCKERIAEATKELREPTWPWTNRSG